MDTPKRVNKTPAQNIQASSDRYYENKSHILREKALTNIKKTGSLPLKSTMEKHVISWEDVARLLCKDEGRNSKNPRPRTKTSGQGLKKIMCTNNNNGDNLQVDRISELGCSAQAD
jgi:hypothetical protein